jgi:transposase
MPRTTGHWRSTPPGTQSGLGASTASRRFAADFSWCNFGGKKTLRASEQLRPDVVAARASFQAEIQQIAPEDLIFVDESGITTQMVRRFARARGGGRAIGRAPVGRYEKLTLLGALGLTGLRALMTIAAATDEAVFLAFVEQVLVPELRPGQVVVFDNLAAHKRPAITAAIEKAECRVILLPPYTPEWNPIEPCWSKIKEFLRSRAARTLETLETAVVDAMDAVSPQDAHGWFRHCGYKTAPD